MNGTMNGFYFGWEWLLWVGFVFVLFSGFGNWGYTYRAHKKFNTLYPQKEALDFLNERYAKGEITQAEYLRVKTEIISTQQSTVKIATVQSA